MSTIKWSIFSLAIIGIALTWILSLSISAIHAAHAFSTFREFESLELIDQAKLSTLKETPGYENYSVYGRMYNIGSLDHHGFRFSLFISFCFVLIAILSLTIRVSTRALKRE